MQCKCHKVWHFLYKMLFLKFSYDFFWPNYKTSKKHIFYSTFCRKMTFTADISITQCAPRGGCRSDFCTSCVCVCVCVAAEIRTPQFVTSAVFNDSKPSLLCVCVCVCVRACSILCISSSLINYRLQAFSHIDASCNPILRNVMPNLC